MLTTWFKDIRFWLVIFALVRLIGITNPPLEIAHNWRQTTVTMVARNFLETDANIFYPRIDIAGEKSGITGMEFPLLNYTIFIAAKLFGYQHWYGRLINLLVSTIGLWYFFKLVKRVFTKEVAFYATLVLLFSVWFAFSRKIMPSTFSMSLMIIGVYHGVRWFLDQGNWKRLAWCALFCMLGVLAKLPSAFLYAIFLLFYFQKQTTAKQQIIFASASLVVIIPSAWWYFYWVPHLVETYGFWHFFMGKPLLMGVQELIDFLPETLFRFYETALQYIGFAMLLFGLIKAFQTKQRIILWVSVLGLLAFSPIMVKAGYNFPHHSYYVVPLVPIMALLAGFGISLLPKKSWKVIVVIGIALECIFAQKNDFHIKENYAAILQLENHMDVFSDNTDLICINSGQNPTPMYFAHRKGWVTTNEELLQANYIAEKKMLGLKYIVVLKQVFGEEINVPARLIFNNEHYKIYRVN